MPSPPPRLSVAAPENKPPNGRQGNQPDALGRSEFRRRQSRRVRLLAEGLLPADDWRLISEPGTRPRILGTDGGPGPDVSLSHSGGWVAAALAEDGRIGIDIEAARPGRDVAAIAKAFLSDAECREVAEHGEAAFLAFWTLREAVAKLSDGGLAAALALDGGTLVAGRNGLCGGGAWVAGHRDLGGVHLAVAWAPAVMAPRTGSDLTTLLDLHASQKFHMMPEHNNR